MFDPRKTVAEQGYDIAPDIGVPSRCQSQEVNLIPGRISDSDYAELIRKLNVKQTVILKHVLKQHFFRVYIVIYVQQKVKIL